MALGDIYNFPANPNEWAAWSFANMAHHRDIIRVIGRDYARRLDEYAIDPFNPMDKSWLNLHATMHTQMDAVLGIAGFDLSEIDWEDQQAVATWWSNHAIEHYQAAAILNLE